MLYGRMVGSCVARSVFSLWLALLPSVALADVEFGGRAGLRSTTLDGDAGYGAAKRAGAAAFASLSIVPSALAAGLELELAERGSQSYRLLYLGLPIVGHFTYPASASVRGRLTAGIEPSRLLSARRIEGVEGGGSTSTSITRYFARWDLALLVGLAVDLRLAERRTLFLELRYLRGLTTVDAGERPLYVTNRELGAWLGMRF